MKLISVFPIPDSNTTLVKQISMQHDSTLPRSLATLLIINSHCESFYPYHWMADGGQVGIFLFFFVAGMGVTASSKTYSLAFPKWYLQRVLRILPTVWLVVPVLLFAKGVDLTTLSLADWFRELIYPISSYTFFFQVFPFYFAGYFLARKSERLLELCLLLGIAYLFFSWPEMVSLWDGGKLRIGTHSQISFWLLYGAIFTLGLIFGKSSRLSLLPPKIAAFLVVVAGLSYLSLKLSMVVIGKFAFAFPLLWLLVALLTVLIFELGRLQHVSAWIHSDSGLPRLLVLISKLSLEVFVVHVVLVRGFDWSSKYFPLNLCLLVMIALAIAWLVNRFVEMIRKRVLRLALSPSGS